jgi:hypothetical protein
MKKTRTMKASVPKKRVKAIEQTYAQLGLGSEDARRYFVGLAVLAAETDPKPQMVFIEAGIVSRTQGNYSNARLETAS